MHHHQELAGGSLSGPGHLEGSVHIPADHQKEGEEKKERFMPANKFKVHIATFSGKALLILFKFSETLNLGFSSTVSCQLHPRTDSP